MTLSYDPTLDQPLDPLQSDYGLSDASTSYPDFSTALQDAGSSSFQPDGSIPLDQSTVDPNAPDAQLSSDLGTPTFSTDTAANQSYAGANSGYSFNGFGDILNMMSSFDTSGGLTNYLTNDPATDPNYVDPNSADPNSVSTSVDPNATTNFDTSVSNDLPSPDMFSGNFTDPTQGSSSPAPDASFMPPPGILQG